MSNCIVKLCKNMRRLKNKNSEVRFFRLPQNKDIREKWMQAIGLSVITIKDPRICSIHFTNDSYEDDWILKNYNLAATNKRVLKNDAIPTLHLHEETTSSEKDSETGDCGEEASCVTAAAENVESLDSVTTVENNDHSEVTPGRHKTEIEKVRGALEVAENAFISNEGKVAKLEEEKQKLKEEKQKLKEEKENIVSNLSNIFTPGQVKMILEPKLQRVRWSDEDYASAMSARSYGHAQYEYWRTVRKVPMPAPSTLRRKASSLNFEPGILLPVFKQMKLKSETMTIQQTLCVASFDEMYNSKQIDIDKKHEQVIGPHKCTQVAMLRGLLSPWKQPVYYDFDKAMTKDILFDIVGHAHDSGFTVVSTVCDLGPSNQKLLSSLNIGIRPTEKRYFIHPKDATCKIYMRCDDPHALKLIRNHFVDSGFEYNGARITTKSVHTLARLQSDADLKIVPGLVEKMLNVVGSERQKVKWAAKLFSKKVASGIRFLGSRGFLSDDPFWSQTADFIELVNDWFDVGNASHKYGCHPGNHAYGIDLESQNKVLDRMTTVMSNMRIISSSKKKVQGTLAPFQKGIILNNMALKELLLYLQIKYNEERSLPISYILTRRLNQDIIEQIFATFRAMGRCDDNPSALGMKYRIRNYILGRSATTIFAANAQESNDNDKDIMLIEDFSAAAAHDVQPDDVADNSLMSNSATSECFQDIVDTGINAWNERGADADDNELSQLCVFPNVLDAKDKNSENELNSETDLGIISLSTFHSYQEENLLKEFETVAMTQTIIDEALKFVCGYVTFKYRSKYPFLASQNIDQPGSDNLPSEHCSDWISLISRGNLTQPSMEIISIGKVMIKIFQDMHGGDFDRQPQVFKRLRRRTIEAMAEKVSVPDDVILCMARCLTWFRVRRFNSKFKEEMYLRKMNKKLQKVAQKKVVTV